MAKAKDSNLITIHQAAFILSTTQLDVQKLMDSGKLERVRTVSGDCTSAESIDRWRWLKAREREVNASE